MANHDRPKSPKGPRRKNASRSGHNYFPEEKAAHDRRSSNQRRSGSHSSQRDSDSVSSAIPTGGGDTNGLRRRRRRSSIESREGSKDGRRHSRGGRHNSHHRKSRRPTVSITDLKSKHEREVAQEYAEAEKERTKKEKERLDQGLSAVSKTDRIIASLSYANLDHSNKKQVHMALAEIMVYILFMVLFTTLTTDGLNDGDIYRFGAHVEVINKNISFFLFSAWQTSFSCAHGTIYNANHRHLTCKQSDARNAHTHTHTHLHVGPLPYSALAGWD